MRTGGAALFQSSDPLQRAAHCGPEVAIGALGCSICRGLPNGMTIPWAATRKDRLTNIAGAVDIDHAAGRGGGRLRREPADHLRDFIGRSDATERDVGDDLRATAA